jgi:ABC-2 type transport system permease protein
VKYNMLNLIRNEWMKIMYRKATYVMMGLLLLAVIGVGIIYKINEPDMSHNDWRTSLEQENAQLTVRLNESEFEGEQQYLKEQIAINTYRLEHDLSPNDLSSLQFVKEMTVLTEIIGLFMIVVAAGSVANEFNWGTIKILLIRPIRRWKILVSKFITVVCFGLFMLVILLASTYVVGAILFGFGSGPHVHLSYVDGEVVSSNLIVHIVKTYLLESIDLFMLSTMAFMISTVFRSGSLAIGIAMFLLFTGSTATVFLAQKYSWTKYLLFANMDLTMYERGTPLVEGMTLPFSITVLIIYFVVFQLVAFLVFAKRDVAA